MFLEHVEVGVKITSCKECSKLNIGTKIHEMFDWSNPFKVIGYNEETEEILLSEEQVMKIIQMVNPAQKPKKIRLVSQDELLKSLRR